MANAFQKHWPEYLMEAFLLGMFMVSASVFMVLLYHPGSPVANAIHGELIRRWLVGLAMGLTAIALIYSPWGKQSGAHMNPAVTVSFLRLGKVAPWDAVFYIVFQCAGGALAMYGMRAAMREAIAEPAVNYVLTLPGADGVGVAFLAEWAISFCMMFAVLTVSNAPRAARHTGLVAGALVMLFITFEAPYSGMSINPARSLASALAAGNWTAFWVYLAAPLTGMLAGAESYVRLHRPGRVGCAKLHHHNAKRCIFCNYQHPELAAAPVRAQQAG